MKKFFLLLFFFNLFLVSLFCEKSVNDREIIKPVSLSPVEKDKDSEKGGIEFLEQGITEEIKDETGFVLYFEFLHPRFGFRYKDIFSDKLLGEPVYFNKEGKNGDVQKEPNQLFNFLYEYSVQLGVQFPVFDWLTFGFNFGIGYEQTPMTCYYRNSEGQTREDLKASDPGVVIDESIFQPSFYHLSTGTSKINSIRGNGHDELGLAYGVVRMDFLPSLHFFPLKNALVDLKGFFIGITPVISVQANSPMKSRIDVLYENGKIGVISQVEGESIAKAVRREVYSKDNWAFLEDYFSKKVSEGHDLKRFTSFGGGAQLDLGWEGILENGAVIKTSMGMGWESDRGFYAQMRFGLGYFFR